MAWFQCTKGHKWWIQGRADAFPQAFRDGILIKSQQGEPFSLCPWCIRDIIGLVTPLEGVEELSPEERAAVGTEEGGR